MLPEIRVVCPSLSFLKEEEEKINFIKSKFEKKGFNVTFGKYVYDIDILESASIEKRVEDLMNAFEDKNVKIILCGKGGYNVNQILPYLDYEKIKRNPKIICGMSDITALLIALNTKVNLTTYLGPNFLGFENDGSFNNFLEILNTENYELKEPGMCIDNQSEYPINYEVIQKGITSGEIFAGNLCTINLLQGTEFFPQKKDIIFFIEDDDNYLNNSFLKEFDRNLESLLQTKTFNIRAIVFGVFEKNTKVSRKNLESIIQNKKELANIPIAMNVNFGHTKPIVTIPIGGTAIINLKEKVQITLTK